MEARLHTNSRPALDERRGERPALRDSTTMSERPPVFHVEPTSSGAPGVIVHGEVDISTATQLTEALDAAIRDSVAAFVIDLSDVVDSSGGRGRSRDERGIRSSARELQGEASGKAPCAAPKDALLSASSN